MGEALMSQEAYPYLTRLADPVVAPERKIIGRDHEMRQVLAAMYRPELSNVLLLAEPGTGKTAIVQGVSQIDTDRVYLEVDPARMISDAGTQEQMAALLKAFFDEAERYVKDTGHELVLFIDEFHQLVQLSDAAVEAIKPVLAASGARGIRVIAATTFVEFHKYISPNQPLVERLQRINVEAPDQKTTITILHGMAERYGVSREFPDDYLFRMIYEYTERYMPASSQPRKSILVLDSMVGWHRFSKVQMNKELLADVLYASLGVNVAYRVDATKVKTQLDQAVYAQDLATSTVARRLQLCVADLHDKTKPTASLLFAGSTGVGKTELTKQLAKILNRRLIRFDMSEFAQDKSLDLFRSELTKQVWNTSHCVLLFDEIEKASGLVTRVLLQVLDDGRLSDDNGREVSFLNTYIVITTNAGSEIFENIAQYESSDSGDGKALHDYMPLFRESITDGQGSSGGMSKFPPELLGRIDQLVPFQPLSEATRLKIVKNKIRKLTNEVRVKHNVELQVDEQVAQYLIAEKGESKASAGGARAAVGRLTSDVTTEIATFLNQYPDERKLAVTVKGTLASDHKNLLTGTAEIQVSAMRRSMARR